MQSNGRVGLRKLGTNGRGAPEFEAYASASTTSRRVYKGRGWGPE
jgi:hypothetical protein